ncbi:MAG: hypothetical protein U0237_08560 [Thermoleophilia bacterium]
MTTRHDTRTPLERRATAAALLTGPALLLGGVAAAVLDPDRMAAVDDPTAGAVLGGLAMFTVFCAVPQALFGLALRGGRRGALTATAVAAPIWALVFGLNPLVQAVAGGFGGVSAVAVLATAAAAVVDVFVTAAAVRGLRRPGTGCDVGAGGLSSAGAQRQHHPRTS